ncbi:hypothetical protein J0663_26390 (plasmid) [Rhizobium lentis]|nr:hypothetical protein J0663_26390 [Rhizobium lentis]
MLKRHGAQPSEQQRLRLLHRICQRAIHRLFHQALRLIVGGADGEEMRFAERVLDVEQRNLGQGPHQRPAAAVLASASGMLAGVHCHQSLVMPPAG